ncbi:WbqC family protein [Winogradskyella sp. MIT101101]|uniref:WbqC family protein n=1 Tax=Winogradskyella sp. MIT101101 TaxID=3098297 RepID=UPI003999EA3D
MMISNNSELKKVIAIMQPYFLPYIGYFQLINSVDTFVVYDDIEYTKKGWINRNRILVNGKPQYISLAIKKDSDYLNVNERYLADSWSKDKTKILNKVKGLYRKAPYYKETMPIIETIINFEESNLFGFIYNSIKVLCEHLEIDTELINSSELDYDPSLKSQDKVLNICEVTKANVYHNSIGGMELYDKESFSKKNINLKFVESKINTYKQFNEDFVPGLSILDVLMFNDKTEVKNWLNNYRLI